MNGERYFGSPDVNVGITKRNPSGKEKDRKIER